MTAHQMYLTYTCIKNYHRKLTVKEEDNKLQELEESFQHLSFYPFACELHICLTQCKQSEVLLFAAFEEFIVILLAVYVHM